MTTKSKFHVARINKMLHYTGLYINIFFLTCPFGQLTKKSTCPTQSFSYKITKTREYFQQFVLVIVSQTLSRPVIINTNRHYYYDIFNRQINIHLDISHWYQTMPSWYECLIINF